jgi:hypothetical protein
VIIFQNEIRRYFEFLGFLGTRQIKVGILAPRGPSTTELIQACVNMAQSKTGALVVIQGKDNLDSLSEGGTPLDGVISEDVILSIFDPHSDGHDGALIIRNNRISRFGAHLPLSTNFKEIGKRGTRHSAALGLSENSDSLCIVVSEEKGKISFCKDGKLKALAKYADLERVLNRFIREKFAGPPENKLDHIFRHNFWLKAGALTTAILIWFFTAYQTGIIEKSFNVPIVLEKIPSDILVENYSPKEAHVTVSGRGDSIFSNITASDFDITYNVSNIKDGLSKIELTKKNIEIPSNLTLLKYEPESFLLTAKKYYTAKLPVKAMTTGSVPEGFELSSVVVTPEFVEVWVPQDASVPAEVLIDTIDVSNSEESVIMPVKMIIPEDIRLVNDDDTVNVALTIEEKE